MKLGRHYTSELQKILINAIDQFSYHFVPVYRSTFNNKVVSDPWVLQLPHQSRYVAIGMPDSLLHVQYVFEPKIIHAYY